MHGWIVGGVLQSIVIVVVGMGGSGIVAAPAPLEAEPAGVPTSACYQAAVAALAQQGAMYSQGGYHADDPLDPRTGRTRSRLGPGSFDCSGLTAYAYAQAGISIGLTTYTQITAGTQIPCTLDDLGGRNTRCWAPGDLVFLVYGGSGQGSGPGSGSQQHVALYVGDGLFMDCYNHRVGCVLHAVEGDPFYQAHFAQGRRIASGCEGMTLDPGIPMTMGTPRYAILADPGDAWYGIPGTVPASIDPDMLCREAAPDWTAGTGMQYQAGCGPPVIAADPTVPISGTLLRQFEDTVGTLGQTGRMDPIGADGVHLHLGMSMEQVTDICAWPIQVEGVNQGVPPPGGTSCTSIWMDPLQFLPQANKDTLADTGGGAEPVRRGAAGDPTFGDALIQLPPPGHEGTLMEPPADPDKPEGTWWSPGNDDRANDRDDAIGGPPMMNWLGRLWCFLFGWLPWSTCT